MTIFQTSIKRAFDAVAAAVGLLLLFLPGLVIGILVKVSSPGPIFFKQERIGRRGESFTCVKFRTMRVDAEQGGPVTTAGDARVTRLGSILRRWKVDELPQLWNVLIGKMSFVGPRPDVSGYADRLKGEARRILDLRPGITGPASIYFRYEEKILAEAAEPKRFNDEALWPVKVRMNLDYARTWHFWKDLGYILITLWPVLNAWLKLVENSPCSPGELLRSCTLSPRESG